MINLLEREICRPGGGQTRNLLITSRTRIQLSHRGRHKKKLVPAQIKSRETATKQTQNAIVGLTIPLEVDIKDDTGILLINSDVSRDSDEPSHH